MVYPRSLDQIPFTVAEPNYPDDLCAYGYRLFDKKKLEPQFPFGFGLSYTTFAYRDLKLTKSGSAVKASFELQNTGSRAGAEVVQLYVGPTASVGDRPVRELKGFAKEYLKPGESRRVELVLSRDAFTRWALDKKRWQIAADEYTINIGASSRDLRLQATVQLDDSLGMKP